MINQQSIHRRAVRVLPEVVQTSGILLGPREENHLAALMFPLRRKSSGVLVFQLAEAAARRIAAAPMECLQQATRARAALGRRQPCFAYAPWRSAWIPWHVITALQGGCRCDDASGVRAYFTRKTDGKALLVVMPSLRWVAYLWRD